MPGRDQTGCLIVEHTDDYGPVVDAFSRRVVGWSMAGHPRTELVVEALDMALGHVARAV